MAQKDIDVFISHSAKDEDIANEVKEFLKSQKVSDKEGSRNLSVWIYNECVEAGQNFLDAFQSAIERSKRVVMICTKDLLESDYCKNEFAMAEFYQNDRGIITCIPVLCKDLLAEDLPVYLQYTNCLNYKDSNFKDKLLSAINNDVKLTSVIEVNRTGVGLAWSYFYGYLDIILPDIQERISARQMESKELSDCPIYPKFVTVVPLSCVTPTNITELDPNFEFAFYIKKEQSVAGNKGRDYSNSVYKFTYDNSKNQKESIHLVMEFATPVRSLRIMCDRGLAKLEERQMRQERNGFIRVVKQILNYPDVSACKGKCLVVDFNDVETKSTSGTHKKETLTQSILSAIEQDRIASTCQASKK